MAEFTGLRRTEPRRFLDASLVPLENALLERAGELDVQFDSGPEKEVAAFVAHEFRALAKEMHHW